VKVTVEGWSAQDTYFDTFPGVWRHGDWLTITGHGTAIVHGRSASTINRHGVRLGSADIYTAVEGLPEVKWLGLHNDMGPGDRAVHSRQAER
jgi:acyl-coenzyme A synthetase/AMP-(fatty) acid ligase